MLPSPISSFRLIHTNSRGNDKTAFDNAVKGFANTLIVIRSTDGYIFGGFVADKWFSGGGWIRGSDENFIFSFGKTPHKSRVKLLHCGTGNGIYISGCGLHLSDDLVAFCSHSCTPTVYTRVAPGFSAQNLSTVVAGGSSYTPDLMEVFVAVEK